MLREWMAYVRIDGKEYLWTVKNFFSDKSLKRYIKRLDKRGKRTGEAMVFYKNAFMYNIPEPEGCA